MFILQEMTISFFQVADFKREKGSAMIKVMIVDDEVLAIDHLKSLLNWQDFGFEIVGEAFSAKKAMELVRLSSPQVIFMDIRMPVVDGLSLSEKVLALNPNIKIVLLTSHRDFEYAKRAINIGISHFLLKHEMNKTSLAKELKKIYEELVGEEEIARSIKSQSIRDLLFFGNKTAINKFYPKEYKGKFLIFYLKVDVPYPIFDERFFINLDLQSKNLEDLNEYSEELEFIEVIPIDKEKAVLLCRTEKRYTDGDYRKIIYQTALKLQRDVMGDVSVSILISPLFNHLEHLPEIYKQCEEKSTALVLFDRGTIINSQDIILSEIDIQENCRKVARVLNENNDEFIPMIRDVFELVKVNFHPTLLKFVCKELISRLERLRNQYHLPSYLDMEVMNELHVYQVFTLEEISQWMSNEYRKITSTLYKANYSAKVELTLRYIHKNYQRDFTINEIGEALSISGDHLRHVFKNETGKTILDYLTWYRIEESKKLLQKEEYKIYEIAEMIGYKTSQYFSIVFKKMTGVTPKDYKESLSQRR